MEVLDIPLQPVQSSNIKAVGYDPANQSLAVQFVSGVAYRYDGVDQATADALLAADSIGSHFARSIRPQFQGVPVQVPKEDGE